MTSLMRADESLIRGSGPGGGANAGGAEKKSNINQELWQACAGPLVNLPAAGTLVYYFPQGHTEQVAASMKKNADAQIPNYQNLPSKLLCLLHSVILQADPKTDEVYAQMRLEPVPSYDREALLRSDISLISNRPQPEFFCKMLTASDTSTHGGFSVPRRAAEEIFPPLDYSMQRPSQELMASDMHDNVWNFRHIYRGQPRRHLLTTGWSLFVSEKRLSAGDSVLFIRDEKQQLLLGIRRANRQSPNLSSSVLSHDSMHIGILARAAHEASNNSPFTIFFNPWVSPSEFVIPLAKYYKAVHSNQISLGMRVRMIETEDSGTRRYMGTITGISDCDPVRWKNSQWRNLQVGWDESADGERRNRVSIWEIEPVTAPIFKCPPPVSQSRRRTQPGMPGPQEIIACAEHLDTSQETTDIPSFNSFTDFFERTTTSYRASGSSIIDHHHQDNKDFWGRVSPSFRSTSTSTVDNFFFEDGHESYGSPNSELSNTVNGCTSLTRQTAVNELIQGREVAKHLRLQLNATSSTENRDLMLQILSSYEKALMILNCSGSIGSQRHDAGVATAVVPGSPRSPNASPPSDADHDGVVKGSQAPPFDTSRKRKSVPRRTYQVRVNPEKGLEGPHDDGFSWSKYGQKDILGAAFPRSRSYYRCTYRNLEGCLATKKEERSDEDPYVIEGTYCGRHTCKIARTDPSKPEIEEQRISTSTFSELAKPQEIIECDDHLDTSQETTVVPSFNSLIHFLKETTTSSRDSTSSIIDHHHHRDNKDFMGSFSPSFESPSTSAADDSSFGDGYESYGNPDSELRNILNGDGGICVATGAEEELVYCRRLETFDLNTDYLLLLLVPSRSIALNLRAECLVEVYLPGSNNALVQDLVNLKQLNLSCSSFTRMPDLSRACKLQSLDLHSCNNLVDVSFIQYLTKLEYINLKGCTSLARLPSLMTLKLLLSLDLSDCINLRRLPPSLGCLSSLAALDLSSCKRIQNLPKGILRLKSVQTLSISGCSLLMEQASGPDGMFIENQVNPRAHTSSHASDEQTLSISRCSMLMERASDPEGMVIEHQVNPIAHSSSHALDEEVSMSYLPVDKYVSKIPLQQPEEERIISKYNSMASKDAAEPSSTTQDIELHKQVLKAYMNMPVDAINQANAFYYLQRTVDSLIRWSPNLNESASLHDLTYCLEELQESVPETMSRMHDARVSKASIQVKLAHLHSSFVQSEGHYNGLAARFSVISDEEEDVDAEIDRLLAKRRELLD